MNLEEQLRTALTEFSHHLVSGSDIEQILRELAVQVAGFLGTADLVVTLKDRQGKTMHVASARTCAAPAPMTAGRLVWEAVLPSDPHLAVEGSTLSLVDDGVGQDAYPMSSDEMAAVRTLVHVAVAHIMNSNRLTTLAVTAAHLRRGLESRPLLEQAKGKIAASLDIDTDAAFDLLRTYARRHQTRLHVVALHIVENRLHPRVLDRGAGRRSRAH